MQIRLCQCERLAVSVKVIKGPGRRSSAQEYGNELNAERVFHSSRKAVRGSTRVARCAGM
jgi:hypothetical protein